MSETLLGGEPLLRIKLERVLQKVDSFSGRVRV